MEILAELRALQDPALRLLDRVIGVELPIPDVALICAFALLLVAVNLSQRSTAKDIRADVEAIYQAELLTANRRAQQAKGELTKAKMEIERERQKRRRDAHGEHRRSRQATSTVVDLPKPAATLA
ncbi:MAG: hypothetical protein AAFY65_02540 [Pseudomonadota bacterium]